MTDVSGSGRIYDISRPISARLAGWPGDTPYRFEMLCRLREGASVNLGTLEMSPHTGTHIDAPYHYDDQGKTVEQLLLETYLGRAAVVDVAGRRPITRQDIASDWLTAPRLLLKTGGWEDDTQFPVRIPVIAADVPEWLREHGVVLLGVDVPSVDHIDSKELPNHHVLGRAGIAILEWLDLRTVPEGFYDLIALPLRLEGGDGCPVRAILRS
ncbi:MAG: arylformamidase [Chthonomonadaceae bacterium]|nr:arylformamidase [Chthonomonadaceae bacterium]